MLYLIKEQDDINKICFYANDLSEFKFEFLIKKHEYAGRNHFSDPNAFIECLNTMDNLYGNIYGYNSNRQKKILIVVDDMIAHVMLNKKFQAIYKELLISCRKLSISLVFITQYYFSGRC